MRGNVIRRLKRRRADGESGGPARSTPGRTGVIERADFEGGVEPVIRRMRRLDAAEGAGLRDFRA